MINTRLTELPEHGHYIACSDRMCSIDRFCRRLCGYTCFVCIVMLVLTWCTIRIGVISIIPNMLGERSDLLPNFFQSLLIIMMAAFSFLSYFRYKIFSVFLFLIYAAMLVAGLFSNEITSHHFSIIIGLGGVIFSYNSFFVYSDYKQLQLTEGFPDFSKRLTFQNQHSEYVPEYKNRYHGSRSTEMSEPEPLKMADTPEKEESGDKRPAEMDEI